MKYLAYLLEYAKDYKFRRKFRIEKKLMSPKAFYRDHKQYMALIEAVHIARAKSNLISKRDHDYRFNHLNIPIVKLNTKIDS